MTNDLTTKRIVVAIDIRGSRDYQNFIFDIAAQTAGKQPGSVFIIIHDTHAPSLNASENIILECITATKVPLLTRSLDNRKISNLLKKYKANILVTSQPVVTKLPQCYIASDPLQPALFRRASHIITSSSFTKNEIIKKYGIEENKIDVVYAGGDAVITAAGIDERESIKERYASGSEYFFTILPGENKKKGTGENAINLLRAFSLFKKMQKSNMQLLIAPVTSTSETFTHQLQSYRYAGEVKVLVGITKTEREKILSAAYACIFPFDAGYEQPVTAMKAGVPVITTRDGAVTEVCGDAVLYADPGDPKDLSGLMMTVYKDETLRRRLIEKGNEQVQKFSGNDPADGFWKSIEKACR